MLDKIKSVQFVMIVSFVASLLLAFVAMSLKPEIDKNILLDKKRSILKSIDIDVSTLSSSELDEKYNSHIQEIVIDKDGTVISDIDLSDIVWVEKDNHFYFTIDNLDLSTNNTGFCRFYLSDDASFNNYETLEIKVEEDNKLFNAKVPLISDTSHIPFVHT